MQQISLECVTSRSLLGRPRDYALIAFNFVGAIVYVCLASRAWTIPRERGLHSATAEPFIWFLSVAPIVAIFFVVNVIWGVLILVRRRWRSGYLWLLTALIWLVAAVTDFAHH
jgi:hypothetical protein